MAQQVYLTIPRIRFSGANAQPAWWLAAAPGPMAFCGFGAALAHSMGIAKDLIGVGAVLHDFRFRAEQQDPWRLHPHQHRAAVFIDGQDYAQGSKTLSGQPTIRGDGTASVLLAFGGRSEVAISKVDAFLRRGRIAGGSIVTHHFASGRARLHSSMAEATASIPGGSHMVDRSELLAPEEGEDPLDAFLRATRRFKGHTTGADSFLTPYCCSYRRITPVAHRIGARDGHPHAFVEPMISLLQLRPRAGGDIEMWRHHHTASEYAVEPLSTGRRSPPPAPLTNSGN